MCVIVHIGAKKTIARQVLQNCYDNNSDGWGIMFATNGKLVTAKDVSSFDEFYKVWKDVPREVERAVHFRIKTHGEINQANCHPFKLSENMGLMHNGIITTHMVQKEMSDTFNYCKYELSPVIAGWPTCLDAEEFKKLVEDATGYSKLLFMDNTGKVVRIRDSIWVEKQGIHFSNASSMDKRYYRSSYSYTKNTSDEWSSNKYDWRNYRNKYDPLYATEDQIKSDLYSGNKTDREGQDYITDLEEEKERIARQANSSTDVIEEDDVNDYEDEPSFTLDLEQLMNMSYEDKLDWVLDYPKSVIAVLEGMMDTLIQAGIFDIKEITNVTDSKKKSAV